MFSLLVSIFIYYIYSFSYHVFDTQYYVKFTFFDVGQGDTSLLEIHRGGAAARILIDGGPNNEIDRRAGVEAGGFPFCYFDRIIVSHTHEDHIKGLDRVLDHCSFGTFIYNDVGCSSLTCRSLAFKIPENKKINYYAGDEFFVNGVYFKFLWPDKNYLSGNLSNPNNISGVLFVDYKNYEVLYTGDAGGEVLAKVDLNSILPYIDDGLDVYKAPHHGSVTGHNLTFLSLLQPKNCVISVGKNNSYGHPSPGVVSDYKKIGCRVRRTDEEGDIEFVFK